MLREHEFSEGFCRHCGAMAPGTACTCLARAVPSARARPGTPACEDSAAITARLEELASERSAILGAPELPFPDVVGSITLNPVGFTEMQLCPGCDNPGCRHGGCQGRPPTVALQSYISPVVFAPWLQEVKSVRQALAATIPAAGTAAARVAAPQKSSGE